GNPRRDTQLRDEVMTLFLAGHETTAIALSWACYLITQHPHVEAKLAEELQTVLGGRVPTPGILPRLRYTEMVLKETMRLYPAVWGIGRRALEDCELGGYREIKRSEEHTSELQSRGHLVCRLLLEKKKSCTASPMLPAGHARSPISR